MLWIALTNAQTETVKTEIIPTPGAHKTMEYCRWTGSFPICSPGCDARTEYEVLQDAWGESEIGACWSGYKGLCCANGYPEEQNKPKLKIDSCAEDEKTVRKCKFPFHYAGKLHYKCTKSDHEEDWCYTDQVMSWGNCRECDENNLKRGYHGNPDWDVLLNVGASETEQV